MIIFDAVLIILLCIFVFFGLFFGMIHALGALVGVIFGALIASNTFYPIGLFISYLFSIHPNTAHILVFIIIFLLINRLIGFGFHLLGRIFGVFERLPFINGINRIFGALFGFIEGVLVLGLILFVMYQLPANSFWVNMINQSFVAQWLIQVAQNLKPLLPFLLSYVS